MNDIHEMKLVHELTNGDEEWLCDTCGRRILFHWPPAYKKTVLVAGDEWARHSMSKGGFSFGNITTSIQPNYGVPPVTRTFWDF